MKSSSVFILSLLVATLFTACMTKKATQSAVQSAVNSEPIANVVKQFPTKMDNKKRVVLAPKIADNEQKKMEIFIGKMETVDCNSYSYVGEIKQEMLEGWGYSYYTAPADPQVMGTLMACPEKTKSERFISFQPLTLDYNGKYPLIFYVPQGFSVKYRMWDANKELIEVK